MSKQTVNSKPTLLQAILIHLKGGDDKKVLKFTERLEKYYRTQIALRVTSIDQLNDQLSDAKEALEDMKVSIDMDSIASAQGLDAYCASYVQHLHSQRKKVEGIEAAIASEEQEIDKLKSLQKFNFAE